MKAVMLRVMGAPENLRLEDVPIPDVAQGQVRIRLKAAALNRRDAYARVGLYPGVKLPAIPGSDGAGVIESVGTGVTHLRAGDAVLINPALNWGPNPRFYGQDFSILGIPSHGTYAEYVTVPAQNVWPKPEYLTWEEAAALPLGGLTAYRALFTRGRLNAGETVIVPGIGGGVATMVLQMAVAQKARVFITSSSDQKLAAGIELGAAGAVNYNAKGWAKSLRQESGGADLSIDSIGGSTFNDLVFLSNPGARIVSFGATMGPVPELLMPRIFFKQLDVMGTTMGSPWDFQEMLDFCTAHTIRPIISGRYPLENVAQAHHDMESGIQFGKLVLSIWE